MQGRLNRNVRLAALALALTLPAVPSSAESAADVTLDEEIEKQKQHLAKLEELKMLRAKTALLEGELSQTVENPTSTDSTKLERKTASSSNNSREVTPPTTNREQAIENSKTEDKDGNTKIDTKNSNANDAGSESQLGGIKFGAGLAFTYDVGNHDRIKSASIVNGVIRIQEQENVRARLLLESHYFFLPTGNFFGLQTGDYGIGPFVAVQGGPSDVIQGIGAGVMLGLKRLRANPYSVGASKNREKAESDGSSFNIGLGIFYDLGVQVLGDGLEVNKTLPAGETEIRYNKRSQSGFMIVTSFAF